MVSLTEIAVPNMNCELCSRTIEIELGKLPGVATVKTSLPQRKVAISHDCMLTSAEAVASAVDSLGYIVAKVKTTGADPMTRGKGQAGGDGGEGACCKSLPAGEGSDRKGWKDGESVWSPRAVETVQTDFEDSEAEGKLVPENGAAHAQCERFNLIIQVEGKFLRGNQLPACVLEKVRECPGVMSLSVSSDGALHVIHDPQSVTRSAVMGVIEKLGYGSKVREGENLSGFCRVLSCN
ncbi:uncharacterized protein [Diadema setosum]|uniref:uncharacterized protein n=1 Tax=Diadema setosum TaxID=31175 RepID=UPI003B3AEF14